jgi:hypothetical protein
MKTHLRLFVVLLFAGFGSGAFAQFNVVVFAPRGEKFTLYINGSEQNTEPAYRAEGDNPGGPTFKLRVFFADPAIREINKTVFNKPGSTMYYKVTKNAKGAYILESTGSEWIDEDVIKEGSTPAPPEGNKAKSGKDKEKIEPVSKTGIKGCDNPMSEPDFNAQLVGISAAPFEPIKLSNAKKLAEQHCLLVSQVILVIYVFDNESSRLNFAKFAFDHTYNPDDYAEVKNALHSQKSKDDLDRFIAGKK